MQYEISTLDDRKDVLSRFSAALIASKSFAVSAVLALHVNIAAIIAEHLMAMTYLKRFAVNSDYCREERDVTNPR
jgi:hypothetical protein